MTLPIMANAEGERFNKVFEVWKGNIFPEAKISDIQRLKKYQKQYKRYTNMDIKVVG